MNGNPKIYSKEYFLTAGECDAEGRMPLTLLTSRIIESATCHANSLGSSSVPQDEVDTINMFGGALPDAIGIPEEQLRKAAKSAVCKINIDSDSRLAMTAAVRKVFAEKPAEFDPRKYLGPARDNMEKLYRHKIVNVLGSAGKAE